MFNDYRNNRYSYSSTQVRLDEQVECNKYVSQVFGTMFLGLMSTAIVSLLIFLVPALRLILWNPILLFGAIIGEFVLVWQLSSRIFNLSYSSARGMFYLYSVLNGITLSTIFFVYEPAAIASTFLITAATFGVMSLYGLSTKKDLTSFGSFAMMGLIGLLILMFVNFIISFFIQLTVLTWIISALGLLIFVGLTAHDAQKIKNYYFSNNSSSTISKLGIVGALSLYLDFINIFIFMLRLFGSNKD